MKSLDTEWTEENLEKYLQAPKNRITFSGLKKKKDPKSLIA